MNFGNQRIWIILGPFDNLPKSTYFIAELLSQSYKVDMFVIEKITEFNNSYGDGILPITFRIHMPVHEHTEIYNMVWLDAYEESSVSNYYRGTYKATQTLKQDVFPPNTFFATNIPFKNKTNYSTMCRGSFSILTTVGKFISIGKSLNSCTVMSATKSRDSTFMSTTNYRAKESNFFKLLKGHSKSGPLFLPI